MARHGPDFGALYSKHMWVVFFLFFSLFFSSSSPVGLFLHFGQLANLYLSFLVIVSAGLLSSTP